MVEDAALQAQLDALRASGAAARNPVRFAYLEGLFCRAATQVEPVRQLLRRKISAVISEIANHPVNMPLAMEQGCLVSPLGELLAHINQHAQLSVTVACAATPKPDTPTVQPEPYVRNAEGDAASLAAVGQGGEVPELKSVSYFRHEWSRLSTEQQLTQTLAQAPSNAGPMNSQHLVLRSLQVMQDISPDYLQGFMSYIDTLIWLEHADPNKLSTARPTSRDAELKAKKRRARR